MRKILFAIIILAFLLRIIGLSDHPAGFTPDEASFGYDAYSILKTGSDQWGNAIPLSFKSFGDYKMPLYGYLTIPSIAIFGLNEFAVRFPNVILGTIAIVATYLLVYEVYKNKNTALFSAFLLAISPWHIPLSRGAFEANLTTFFLPFAIYLFFRGIKNNKFYIWSAFFFGLNLFTYHSARLVTPLIVMFLVWNRRDLLNVNKYTKIATGLFSAFFIIAAYTYLTGAGARVASAGIISLIDNVGPERYRVVMTGLPDFIARIFNNKLTYLISMFGKNYVMYFSPQFLFTQGVAEGTYGMYPGRGVLYFTEVIFLGGFIWGWFSGNIKNINWLLLWILIAPIPAALSVGPGYAANRAVIMLPAIQIMLALGGLFIYKKFISNFNYKLFLFGAGILFLINFSFFTEDYFAQQPASQASSMIYGQRELFNYLRTIEDDYMQIIISKKISEAHIYLAFYNNIPPSEYQENTKNWKFDESGLDWVDQLPKYSIGKYVFQNLDWSLHSQLLNTLLVGTPEEFSEDAQILNRIYYPNKKDAYWVVDPNPEIFAHAEIAI